MNPKRHYPVISILAVILFIFLFCTSLNASLSAIGSIFLILAVIGSFVLFIFSFLKTVKGSHTEVEIKRLLIPIICVWIFGFVSYLAAFYTTCKHTFEPISIAELISRSAIGSTQLFIFNIDSNVIDNLREISCPHLIGIICCAGFLAALCSAALIINLFFRRFRSYLHLRRFKIDREKPFLYIFFDINDASLQLAQSIRGKNTNAKIIFVENNLQADENSTVWSRILRTLTYRDSIFTQVKEDENTAIAFSDRRISDTQIPQGQDALIWEAAGLQSLADLLKKLQDTGRPARKKHKSSKRQKQAPAKPKAQLHIFFLSDNMDINAREAGCISKDSIIKNAGFETFIYCNNNETTRRMHENLDTDHDTQKSGKIDIKTINASILAIDRLKRNITDHPVNFVEFDKKNPGTTGSTFTSLIVGFGETGQEAVRFLYEFGAFVGSESSDKATVRSPFHCHIVDKNMDNLKGRFCSEAPHVPVNINGKRSGGTDKGDVWLKFLNADYESSEFYEDILNPIADRLNYVVIATGDDRRNIKVAVNILRHVVTHRENLDKFCIFVRVYENSTLHRIKTTTKYYNDLIKNASLSGNEDKIHLFGSNNDIFTYDLIIDDDYMKKGHEYCRAYLETQAICSKENILIKNDPWTERYEKLITAANWKSINELRRKETQDFANALHAGTKIEIIKHYKGDHLKDFSEAVIEHTEKEMASFKDSQKSISQQADPLVRNLAIMEHMRWNATQEILGYRPEDKTHSCNDIARTHNCLRSWEEIDKESKVTGNPYKAYDFCVVATSLKIALEEEHAG